MTPFTLHLAPEPRDHACLSPSPIANITASLDCSLFKIYEESYILSTPLVPPEPPITTYPAYHSGVPSGLPVSTLALLLSTYSTTARAIFLEYNQFVALLCLKSQYLSYID